MINVYNGKATDALLKTDKFCIEYKKELHMIAGVILFKKEKVGLWQVLQHIKPLGSYKHFLNEYVAILPAYVSYEIPDKLELISVLEMNEVQEDKTRQEIKSVTSLMMDWYIEYQLLQEILKANK